MKKSKLFFKMKLGVTNETGLCGGDSNKGKMKKEK
jgi:hypothetical protein